MKLLRMVGSLVAALLALVLLILFFLPWVEMSPAKGDRGDYTLASGWQLSIGTVSVYDEGKFDKSDTKEGNKIIKARPWFWLGLLLPLGLLAACGLSLAGMLPQRGAGVVFGILAVLGLIVVILGATVDYCDEMYSHIREERTEGLKGKELAEMEKELDKREDEFRKDFDKEMDIGGATSLWLSLVFYILVLGAGGADVALSIVAGGRRAAAPPPPPPGSVG